MKTTKYMKMSSFLILLVCTIALVFAIGCGSDSTDDSSDSTDTEESSQVVTKTTDEPENVVEDDTDTEDQELTNVPDEPKAEEPKAETAKFDRTSEFFTLMDNACVSCHSEAYAGGELAIDSYKALMAGGMTGATVVAGDAKSSSLFTRLTADVGQMPPSEKLSKADMDLIQAWIDAGAPDID